MGWEAAGDSTETGTEPQVQARRTWLKGPRKKPHVMKGAKKESKA